MTQNSLKKVMIIGMFTFLGTFTINGQSDQKQRPQERPTTNELFEQMDADEDGKLSKKEVKGPLKNDFSRIDTNEDGYLTKEELEKAPKPERQGQGRSRRN